MNAWIVAGNAWADRWIEAMVRASWQGAVALVVVWAVCVLWARRGRGGGARAEGWLWRLGYLKFVVCVVGISPVVMAVLPAARETRPAVMPVVTEVPSDATPVAGGEGAAGIGAAGDALSVNPVARQPASVPLTWKLWLMLGWIAGVGVIVVRMGNAWVRTWRLRRRSRAIEGETRELYVRLARRMGVRRLPALLQSETLRSPMLVGALRPAIVLPTGLAADSPTGRIEMMLAHELAHRQRRDLLWNWLHAAVETAFFFHPAIWLARREWRAAREIACDEATLAATGARAGDYANTLLDLIAGQQKMRPRLVGVGVAESFGDIQRRLMAMKKHGTWSRRRLAMAGAVVGLAGIIGVMPWRVEAQKAPAATTPAEEAKVTGETPALPPDTTLAAEILTRRAWNSTGVIAAATMEIRSPVDGTLEAVKAKEGDKVKKGALLFQFESRDEKSEVNLAEIELQRDQAIVAGGNTGLAKSKAELEDARYRVAQDEVILEVRKNDLAKRTILASIDGVVDLVQVAEQQFVVKGTLLARIVDLSELRLEFAVPSGVELKIGQKVLFLNESMAHSEPWPKNYTAVISFISPTVDDHGVVKVRGTLTADVGSLKPGTFVAVRPE